MSIPKPTNTEISADSLKNKSISSNSTFDYTSDLINAFHSSQRKNASDYKSLDFSDVSIYGKGDSQNTANKNERFRHFHQMRLFIDRGTTIKHGKDSSSKTMIVCNLPEQIQYSLDSEWNAPIKFGDGMFNLFMQMGADLVKDENGKSFLGNAPSGVLRASTFRLWQNTKPLSLILTIPVIDDEKDVSGTNLVEALEILGSLVLPRKNGGYFYTPPPSPANLHIDYTTITTNEASSIDTNSNYARIMLQLGGILLVDKCIVESVQVQYPNTKAQIMHDYSMYDEYFGITGGKYLHPLLAIVTLKISTLEALTSDTYSKMLWARSQPNEGNYNFDATPITKTIYKLKEKIWPSDNNNNNGQQNPQQNPQQKP